MENMGKAKLLDKVTNKELRKFLLITVGLGFAIGAAYFVVLNNYVFPQLSVNLRILQRLEIFDENSDADVIKQDSDENVLLKWERDFGGHNYKNRTLQPTRGVKIQAANAIEANIETENSEHANASTSNYKLVNTRNNTNDKKKKCDLNKSTLGK